MKKCTVCVALHDETDWLCASCRRSLRRAGGSTFAIATWAAKRTRYYERKRAKRDARFCAACMERPV